MWTRILNELHVLAINSIAHFFVRAPQHLDSIWRKES